MRQGQASVSPTNDALPREMTRLLPNPLWPHLGSESGAGHQLTNTKNWKDDDGVEASGVGVDPAGESKQHGGGSGCKQHGFWPLLLCQEFHIYKSSSFSRWGLSLGVQTDVREAMVLG